MPRVQVLLPLLKQKDTFGCLFCFIRIELYETEARACRGEPLRRRLHSDNDCDRGGVRAADGQAGYRAAPVKEAEESSQRSRKHISSHK